MRTFQTPTRLFSALIMAATLSGCMTAPKPIDPATAAKIKRTDVISVAAAEFSRRYVGLTVFNNETETLPILDWAIDKAYETQIAEAIKTGRDITVIHAPYKREQFAKANEINRSWEGGYAWQDIASAAREHCATHSLDALFVLIRGGSGDFLAGTNQSFYGVGMYARGGMGSTNAYLHVVTRLALLDCQTGLPLETRLVAAQQDGLPGHIARTIPYQRTAPDNAKKPLATWTETDLAEVRKTLIQLPRGTWPITVNSILPPPQPR